MNLDVVVLSFETCEKKNTFFLMLSYTQAIRFKLGGRGFDFLTCPCLYVAVYFAVTGRAP